MTVVTKRELLQRLKDLQTDQNEAMNAQDGTTPESYEARQHHRMAAYEYKKAIDSIERASKSVEEAERIEGMIWAKTL